MSEDLQGHSVIQQIIYYRVTQLIIGFTAVNMTGRGPCPHGANILIGRRLIIYEQMHMEIKCLHIE